MSSRVFLQDRNNHNNKEWDTGPISRFGVCMRPHTFAWVGLLLIVSVCAVHGWLEKPASGYRWICHFVFASMTR